ncbi:MAG: PGPGW domain-containing protein [Actinomycetota bacterium]|nr:PGPGW domain-containing protein [Actinomycetota bacterium]
MSMGITDRLDEQRNRIALNRAEPHLDDGEEIHHWVRIKHADTRKEGFAYVTDRRLLVRWQGRSVDGHQEFHWERLESWGIEADASGGPILCVESEENDTTVQLPARSRGVAERVSQFLHHFAERAPKPSRKLKQPDRDNFVPDASVKVTQERRNAIGQTKRIVVTIIGLALIVFATLIIPLPGPWSILLTIAGLAVLATEYDWAKDVSDYFKDKYEATRDKIKARRQSIG